MVKLGKFGGHSGNESSAKRGIAKLAGGLPALLLAFMAWAVALAGTALLRHEGGENVLSQELSFTWWVVFFSLFVLLAAGIHLIGAGIGFLPIGAAAISGILAVVTALTMLETQRWNSARRITTSSDRLGKGVRLAFAGFLALSALNAILILILGNAQDSHRSHQQSAVRNEHPANPGYATTGVSAPGQTGITHAQTHAPSSVNVV